MQDATAAVCHCRIVRNIAMPTAYTPTVSGYMSVPLLAGFIPIPASISSYAGALVGAVVIEEIARLGVVWMQQ